MVLKDSFLLFWLIAIVYAAPVIVTVVHTQYVDATVVAPPAAIETAPAAVPAAEPVAQAAVAPAAPAAAPAAPSSSGFSLSSFLNSDFLNRWLAIFNIGQNSELSPAPTPVVTAPIEAPQDVPSTFSPISPPVLIEVPSTFTTSSLPSSTPTSSVPNGDIYAEMSQDSRVDITWGKAMLDLHNKYRSKHQVDALSWSDAAYKYAQNVADSYDCSGILTHTYGPFGENLSAGYGKDTTGLEAWYDEVKDYNWQAQNTYDHFTQVVWKSTTLVGCAYKDCRKNNWGYYAICSYTKPGNVVGKNTLNVFPATS